MNNVYVLCRCDRRGCAADTLVASRVQRNVQCCHQCIPCAKLGATRHDATHRSIALGGVLGNVTRSDRLQNRVVLFEAMRNCVKLEKSEGGSRGDEGSYEKACVEVLGEAQRGMGTTGTANTKKKKKKEGGSCEAKKRAEGRRR